MLTRETFLTPAVLPREEVAIPEMGGSVFVRTMTAGERDRYELEHFRNKDRDVRARLAAYTVCDADGKLLFTPTDIPALSAGSAAVLSRIFNVAVRLNHLTPDDVAELEKN